MFRNNRPVTAGGQTMNIIWCRDAERKPVRDAKSDGMT